MKIPYFDIELFTASQMIDISLLTTILQILKVLIESKMMAAGMKEGLLIYFMNTMTARTKWYPFKHKFMQRENQFNVNFGCILI